MAVLWTHDKRDTHTELMVPINFFFLLFALFFNFLDIIHFVSHAGQIEKKL